MSDKIVLLDGHSILNRAFYGVPDLSNAEGLHTNAVYGFLNILFKILDEEQPQYLAVAFDLHAPTFRHKMYDQYKGTRKPMPQTISRVCRVSARKPRRKSCCSTRHWKMRMHISRRSNRTRQKKRCVIIMIWRN